MTNKIYVLQKPELVVGVKDFKAGAEFGIDSELSEIYFMREINTLKTLVVFESEFKLAFEDKASILTREEQLKKEQKEKARKKWEEEELKASNRHVHTDMATRHVYLSQYSADEEEDEIVHDTLNVAVDWSPRSTDSSDYYDSSSSSSSSSYDSGSSSSYDSSSSSFDSGSW